MKNQNIISPNAAKYKNARLSLLLVFAFSAVNLALMFADSYFLFSARIPLVFAVVGFSLYQQSLEVIYLVVAIVLAVLILIPYLLCWLFSKKRVGWMIAALVLFAIDTIVLLIDVPTALGAGDLSIFLDVIIHGIIIYELAVGVASGFKLKKEAEQIATEEQQAAQLEDQAGEQVQEQVEIEQEQTRIITITRKKSFVGCANPIVVYVNGQAAVLVKNGQSEKVTVPAADFQLGAALPNGFAANSIVVPAEDNTQNYYIQVKMGFSSSTIAITKE